VPTHGFPAFDLTAVFFRHPPAQIIAAIPLEPAARVIGVNPTLGAPFRQRLACSYPEEIERAVAAAAGRGLGAYKPAVGKFLAAVGQVLAAEYAEAKHVPRREIGIKLRIEVAADRRREPIPIALLHPIVDDDDAATHPCSI